MDSSVSPERRNLVSAHVSSYFKRILTPYWSSFGHFCSSFISGIVKSFDRSHVLGQPLPCGLPYEKSAENTLIRYWLVMKKTLRTKFTPITGVLISPQKKKTIEMSPFFVRRRGHCCRGDLVGRTTF